MQGLFAGLVSGCMAGMKRNAIRDANRGKSHLFRQGEGKRMAEKEPCRVPRAVFMEVPGRDRGIKEERIGRKSLSGGLFLGVVCGIFLTGQGCFASFRVKVPLSLRHTSR